MKQWRDGATPGGCRVHLQVQKYSPPLQSQLWSHSEGSTSQVVSTAVAFVVFVCEQTLLSRLRQTSKLIYDSSKSCNLRWELRKKPHWISLNCHIMQRRSCDCLNPLPPHRRSGFPTCGEEKRQQNTLITTLLLHLPCAL